jgi:hypothetical protein
MKKMLRSTFLLFTLISTILFIDVVVAQNELSINYISDQGVDLDEDGLLDHIEVILDVSVPVNGIYVIETSDINSTSGQMIPINVYKRLSLTEGEHRITINFDGRRIHSTQKNPEKLAYIGLISLDYSEAKFLNDVKFSNEYDYNDFETPPEYTVGVKSGDIAIYNITETFIPSNNSPPRTLESLILTTEGVNGSVVFLELGFQYSDGTAEVEKIDGYLEKDSLIFPFLIPAELGNGDIIGSNEKIILDETLTMEILGYNKTLFHYEESRIINRTDVDYVFNQEYYWDKDTGIMTSAWFNTSTVLKMDGSEFKNNVYMELFGSTLIPEFTSLQFEIDDEKDKIFVQLLDSDGDPIPNGNITLKTENKDLGVHVSNFTGHVEIDIPDDGNRLIATYPGSLVFSSAESEILLDTEKSNNIYLIAILLVVILIIVVILLLRRFS